MTISSLSQNVLELLLLPVQLAFAIVAPLEGRSSIAVELLRCRNAPAKRLWAPEKPPHVQYRGVDPSPSM